MIFCMQMNVRGFFKLLLSFRCAWTGMPKLFRLTSLLFLCNIVKDGDGFFHTDKYQSFLKVCFNTLDIKVSYKFDIIIIYCYDQAFSNYSK